ncbi:MAG: hypothetical protein PWP52_1200 [Bacteroidales bacterium]|nr:hypothetical protein [Bacteroidales bacterium]MDN5291350.1 hypothetical protein [Anaerophaga sp.]
MNQYIHADKKENKKRPNKSSIIRIMVSDFDDEYIQEIKVLYTKQGGVDTFKINKMSYDSASQKIIFEEVATQNMLSVEDSNLNFKRPMVECKNGDIYVVKPSGKVNAKGQAIEPLRSYKIHGKYLDLTEAIGKDNAELSGKKQIYLHVEDLLGMHTTADSIDRRRLESETQRTLLSKEVMENYALIMGHEIKLNESDETYKLACSKEIYKANRFLDYRSRLLYYYSFINHFLAGLSKGATYEYAGKSLVTEIPDGEVWQLCELEVTAYHGIYINKKTNELVNENCLEIDAIYAQMAKNMRKTLNEFVENYNAMIEKQNELNKNKPQMKKAIVQEPIKFENFTEEKINQDLHNIVYILSDLRHKLMHFEYRYFDLLMTGKKMGEKSEVEVSVPDRNSELPASKNQPSKDKFRKGKKLSELLNLNILKELDTFVKVKESYQTTYLETNDKIEILGKLKTAKSIYQIYHQICQRKNGFNKFINSFFIVDGEENTEVKDCINEVFRKEIHYFETEIAKSNKDTLDDKYKNKNQSQKTRDRMEDQIEECKRYQDDESNIDTWVAYHKDIHYSKRYKKLYSKHKTLVGNLNSAVSKGLDGQVIKKINDDIAIIKREMNEITKANSKSRLRYKMQMAYGFLFVEYGLKIPKFLNDFDLSHERTASKIKGYTSPEKVTQYLTNGEGNKDNFNLDELTKNFKKQMKFEFLKLNEDNNLIKLYILIYQLLPRELKGDFLGFVKSNYYDLKHVDFQTRETEAKDQFFHNMRLFEKNVKAFDLIQYSIGDEMSQLGNETFNFSQALSKIVSDDTILNSATEIPNINCLVYGSLLKYYENAFRLSSEIEIRALIKIARKEKEVVDHSNSYSINKAHSKIEKELKERDRDKEVSFFCILEYAHKNSLNQKGDYTDSEIYDKASNLRNKIAHCDYRNLFITNIICEAENINVKVKYLIDVSNTIGLNTVDLGNDMVNDYLMSYDKQMTYLVKTSEELLKESRLDKSKEKKERRDNLKNETRSHSEIYMEYEWISDYLVKLKDNHEILLKKNKTEDLKLNRAYELIKNYNVALNNKSKIKISELTADHINNNWVNIWGVLNHELQEINGLYLYKVTPKIKKGIYLVLTDKKNYCLNINFYTLKKVPSKDDSEMTEERYLRDISEKYYFTVGEDSMKALKDRLQTINDKCIVNYVNKIDCKNENLKGKSEFKVIDVYNSWDKKYLSISNEESQHWSVETKRDKKYKENLILNLMEKSSFKLNLHQL